MSTIAKITPLWSTMPSREKEVQVEEKAPVASFTDIFRTIAKEAADAQAKANQTDYLLATGQLENPAVASIAWSEAELSVSMLAQLRNKALDAYSELMRISM